MGYFIFKRKKKGVTLLELLLVLAISTLFLGVIYTLFLSSSRLINETQIRSDLQREGAVILTDMSENLMQAKKIVDINDNNGGVLSENNRNIVMVKVDTVTGNVVYEVDNSNNKLLKNSSPLKGIDINNTITIKSLNFKSTDGNAFSSCRGVKISLTLTQRYINKDIDYTITSNIVFRNYTP